MSDLLLSVQDLRTWLYTPKGTVRAVDGISFELEKGRTFALLGESGCGKSMTALSIMRLLPAAGRAVSGSVDLDGWSLLDLPEMDMRAVRGGRIAMIFQEPQSSLNPVLTVGDQVGESVRVHHGLTGRAARRRVVELLNEVGIPDPGRRSEEFPHQLSGGMKQRVMIAIALAGAPDLLIADEPTTALDVTIQAQVLDLLRRLQQETGMAILLITHDLSVVAGVADEVAVMYAGHIVEQSSCREFFDLPQHPYSQKLFASVPTAAKRDRRLAVISGAVPSLAEEFPGCRFEARCDRAWDLCRQNLPPWVETGQARGVRCHLYGPAASCAPATPAASPVTEVESRAGPAQGLETLLHVRGLKVYFPIRRGLLKRTVGWVRAVDDLSLDIAAGRTLALVGESGCGKTSAGKGLLQLIRPTSGSVRFAGQELTRMRAVELRRRRRDMQIIFQDPYSSMNPRMMISQIIEEGMMAQGLGGDEQSRQARADALLDQVGLDREVKHRYPHEFSGGQRQRICIARALAVDPKLVVCDEPTSALDVSVQAQILNLLRDLQSGLDLAYLFITHNISVVEYLAHEVAVMYLGRIVERGTVEEILNRPRHPYTEALLSAVPVIDEETRREVIRLEGDLPSPANPPTGCHFHPRCPKAMPQCRESYPREVIFSETHNARCLLYGA
jgi:peptide/nickel transport system ATP-binding protein